MPVVGCLTCKVRREVPRWPLPGVACACGGPLSLEAGRTQFLERELVRAAKQAGADALERTIDDAKVLPLPLRAPVPTRRPDLDPLERTADDAEVLPLPAGGKKSSGPLPAPLGHTLEDARVLATPHLVWQLELTAREAILPFLDEGEDSVGTEVNLRHLAATPLGMSVAFRARVEEVSGRRVKFIVEAEDERELVASGTHERFVVQVSKFITRLAAKRAGQ